MNRAVFLDRDGTLIEDRGYICLFSQVGFYPFAIEAVKFINQNHYKCIVVTNQSAVARGICSDAQVKQLNQELTDWFFKQGAIIDDFYHCPFHEAGSVHPYNTRSDCRKPEPGMLLQAAGDHSLNLAESYMIGDKACDIMAGRKAGCKTILVKTGDVGKNQRILAATDINPDFQTNNILSAVNLIFKS